MATIGQDYLTLKDMYAQMGADGKVTAALIELFMTSNAILEDAIAVECNEGTSHKTTVRNGLPDIQFRNFYQGVKCTKGDYTTVTDTTSMLDAYSEVDKKLADINGNTAQFRLNEAEAHVQAMNKTVKTNIFYGAKGKNASFDGLATRYNKISNKEGEMGYQVIDAGGQGDDNTSIWFVTWGDKHTHLLYPKGSKAGLQRTDKGQITAKDPEGRNFEAYQDYFSWDTGLSVRNYRSSARIANISLKDLEDGKVDLIDKMVEAFYKVEEHAQGGKTICYANNTIRTWLHKQAMNKKNVNLTIDTAAGKPMVNFLGLPIKPCSEILNTEARVA